MNLLNGWSRPSLFRCIMKIPIYSIGLGYAWCDGEYCAFYALVTVREGPEMTAGRNFLNVLLVLLRSVQTKIVSSRTLSIRSRSLHTFIVPESPSFPEKRLEVQRSVLSLYELYLLKQRWINSRASEVLFYVKGMSKLFLVHFIRELYLSLFLITITKPSFYYRPPSIKSLATHQSKLSEKALNCKSSQICYLRT